MYLYEICQYLEAKYPLNLQESYDNSGLLYGHLKDEIFGALITLDLTESIVDEALSNKCNLIIAHHPIIFNSIKKLNRQTYVERIIEKCIQKGISLYAIHTNLDNHSNGVNAKIAEKIGLKNCRILRPMNGLIYKLEVYVPTTHLSTVDQAILDAGAGQMGAYSECHFRTQGIGTFTPKNDAKPHIGTKNVREEVQEFKVEYLVENQRLKHVLDAMYRSHPYEEVAHFIFNLSNTHTQRGAGMIGELSEAVNTDVFLNQIKQIFKCGTIKHTAIHKDKIQTVALCGGAGSFLVSDAIGSKADIYISSDFKYHEFFDADNKIIIADIGHYESEQFTSELLAEQLIEKFPNFAIHLTKLNTNPVNYL